MILFAKDIELLHFSSVEKIAISKDYLSWISDYEVIRLIASPLLLGPKSADFIDQSYERFTSSNCKGFFIKDIKSKKFIGTAKIDKIDNHNKSAEIGVMIGNKDFWGMGIATESCKALMYYVFNQLEFHRVWGGTSAMNLAMQKTFLKLGFEREAVLRDYNLIEGKFVDNYQYSILEKEYFANQK